MRLAASHFQAPLASADGAVAALIAAEARRAALRLELVASENHVSLAQLQACGSQMENVTVEGYPGKRFLGSSMHVDALEQLAVDRARRLFGAGFANVQPHSGTQANQAVMLALLQPGDTVLSMRLCDGGHFSHGDAANLSGALYQAVFYGVGADGCIDYLEVDRLARAHAPKLLIAGASAYPRVIDFARMAEIAHAVGAHLLADIAHVAGLVASGLFPHPLPHADVVTTTTYKNLRGPRGGLILCNDESLAQRIDIALCPLLQGTPIMGLIAAKAVAFGEALAPGYADYSRSVLANARVLADRFSANGFRVVTGGTDTPFVVLDLRPLGLNGKVAASCLDTCSIGANAVPVPGDADFEHASGLRLGVSALTTRGFGPQECESVADLVSQALQDLASGEPDAHKLATLTKHVTALCERFPIYSGSDGWSGSGL